MASTYKTKAFILRQEDSGEADRILSLYTKDYGFLEVLAKGERKINSKLRAFLQPFSLCDVEFVQGRFFKTVIDSSIVESFDDIKKNMKKVETASLMSEAIIKAIPESQKDDNVWSLILVSFGLLDKIGDGKEMNTLYHFFVIRLISLLGYRIDLSRCGLCGNKISKECYILLSEKIISCPNCKNTGQSKQDRLKIDFETMVVLKYILKSKIDVLLGLDLSNNHFRKLNLISKQYIEL